MLLHFLCSKFVNACSQWTFFGRYWQQTHLLAVQNLGKENSLLFLLLLCPVAASPVHTLLEASVLSILAALAWSRHIMSLIDCTLQIESPLEADLCAVFNMLVCIRHWLKVTCFARLWGGPPWWNTVQEKAGIMCWSLASTCMKPQFWRFSHSHSNPHVTPPTVLEMSQRSRFLRVPCGLQREGGGVVQICCVYVTQDLSHYICKLISFVFA